MKRRKEHLVEKRDGRREFMRSTKLARSIHLAMHSVGIDEDWRAIEFANVVLTALRERVGAARADGAGRSRAAAGEASVLRTADIADAVQHVLVATGQPNAAVAYGAVAAERARRHRPLATLGRSSGGPGVGPHAAPGLAVERRNLDDLGRN
ncbi:MAG: hypothetical protein NXI31_03090 [bacterium]|nr:hypothetical protein [bacterium]